MANEDFSDVMDTLLADAAEKKKRILLETGTNELEILEFYLDVESGAEMERIYFGINVAKVREVIESTGIHFTDSSVNPCFIGTTPLRGHVLPLIDISRWLDLKKERRKEDIIIVTEFSKSVTGFLVSGVTSIHRVGWEDVMSPDQFSNYLGVNATVGNVFIEDHITQLLDLEHVVSQLNPEESNKLWETDVRADIRYKVLVAEDSPTIGMMIKKNIEAANMAVDLFQNGKLAHEHLQQVKEEMEKGDRTLSEYIHIVISDIEMPQMDGFTLTKKIREDHILKGLPVILYSSIITKELKHKGESVGANIQIAKPDLNEVAKIAIGLIEQDLNSKT